MIREIAIPGDAERLAFPAHDVDVWVVSLPAGMPQAQSLRPLLSDVEKQRAERFHRNSDGAGFIVAHAALRLILGRRLQADPGALLFETGSQGKPFLVRQPGAADIRFNLSHSGDKAAIAVTRGRDVGVDIEHLVPRRSDLAVAKRFFSPAEIAALSGLSKAQRATGFFNCWTRKEAYIKARGEGLSIPLDSFDVSLAPGTPAALLASRFDPTDVDRWHFQDIPVGDEYVAAFAVERI